MSEGDFPLKHTSFLAIANVLLLRQHIRLPQSALDSGSISSTQLMQAVLERLEAANQPRADAEELEKLTQEKTLQDVKDLLPSLLVGLDVNVRFRKTSDFEYTVACAIFDMLDIILVHGWLVDPQDTTTSNVVGSRSYNELVERLMDYRGILMTESKSEASSSANASTPVTEATEDDKADKVEEKAPATTPLLPPLSIKTSPDVVGSVEQEITPQTSVSPSKQTIDSLKQERQLNDSDALQTATTLLQEGPVLEDFFHDTASQLTYTGLIQLHEDVRERQLCVFFRNNHFSSIFKFDGSLYLLVTDVGYYDEPSVVWEKLSEIHGDTSYFDQDFRPLNAAETRQQSILTSQEHTAVPEPTEEEKEALKAQEDADLALAMKLQEEEDGQSNTQTYETVATDSNEVDDGYHNQLAEKSQPAVRSYRASSQTNPGGTATEPPEEPINMNSDGELVLSQEDIEAQRQAEAYYAQKRQDEQDQRRYQEQLARELQHQQQAQRQRQASQPRQNSGSDCSLM